MKRKMACATAASLPSWCDRFLSRHSLNVVDPFGEYDGRWGDGYGQLCFLLDRQVGVEVEDEYVRRLHPEISDTEVYTRLRFSE